MKVIAITYGTTTEIVSACEVGTITKQAEGKSFEFLVDDFSFSLADGAKYFNAMLTVPPGETIRVKVFDDETGVRYFKGFMTAEGCSYSEDDGFYQFRAVEWTKFLADKWRATPAVFRRYLKSTGGGGHTDDVSAFPKAYLELSLRENLGMEILLPYQFHKTDASLNDAANQLYCNEGYSVFDLLSDTAKYTNSILYVDDRDEDIGIGVEYVRLQSRQDQRRDVNIGDRGISGYIKRLRSAEYTSVVYTTSKGNIAIETADGFRVISGGSDFETTGALDLTVINNGRLADLWGASKPVLGSPLEILFPPRDERRQGTWDDLLRTKCEYELTIDGTVDVDVSDRVWGADMPIVRAQKITYDIVEETTTINATS